MIRSATVAWLMVCGPATLLAQQFPTLPADAPAGTGEVRACEIEDVPGARCGRFRVYEDRVAEQGRALDLAFIVLPALEVVDETKRALVFLPGGPGESFTGGVRGIARGFASHRQRHDLLLVDVRGVGRSAPLVCPGFQIPLRERFGTVFPMRHITMCRDALAKRARLDLYTTDHSVDDIEELRRWLGYPQVDLSGGSYGTRVAQVYMRRHPEAVRTVILNSVAPVFEPGYVHMARTLQTSLDLVVEACERSATCDQEHPDLSGRLERVLDRLRRGPVTLTVRGENVRFTLGDFAYALRGLLYGRARDVPALIHAASENDFDALAEYYLERTAWVGEEDGTAAYHFSALCAEDIAPLTDDDVAKHTAGTFMGDHLIAGYREVCSAWPAAKLPPSWWEPVRSDVPVLIFSGERDPVTPPSWGEAVARHLPNSLHIVVPGGGHGPRNACTRRLEAQLLREASIAGLDTSCAGAPPGRL